MNPVIIKTTHKRAVRRKNLREFTSLIFFIRVIKYVIKWMVNAAKIFLKIRNRANSIQIGYFYIEQVIFIH